MKKGFFVGSGMVLAALILIAATTDYRILRIYDSIATLRTSLQNAQIAITSDSLSASRRLVYKDGNGKLYFCLADSQNAVIKNLTVTGTYGGPRQDSTRISLYSYFSDSSRVSGNNGAFNDNALNALLFNNLLYDGDTISDNIKSSFYAVTSASVSDSISIWINKCDRTGQHIIIQFYCGLFDTLKVKTVLTNIRSLVYNGIQYDAWKTGNTGSFIELWQANGFYHIVTSQGGGTFYSY